jgi:drug/metabolite transporter (DMT)-like permease
VGTTLELLSIMMILVTTVATGISNVMMSLNNKYINPFVLSASSLFFGGIMLYLISIPVEGRPKGPEWLTISGIIIITISLILYYTNNKEEITVLNN